ncbi:MAG TPA: hypothetical protein VGG75_38070 [Trebonia sp.]|jgi:hypothetical protein
MTNVRRTNPGSYTELRMWAEEFADAQAARIAFENTKRSGTVTLDALGPVLELYKEAEKRLEAELTACYRMTVPESVQRWQQESAGIGEHTLARLLGITGDPRTASPRHWEGEGPGRHLIDDEEHPRGVGELWQYCSVGAPKNRNVKGDADALMANGRPDAKKLVYLMSVAQVKSTAKAGTGYRKVYDDVKAAYSGRVHTRDCVGGYSGKLYVKCKTHVPDDTDPLATPDDAAGGKVKLGYALAGDPYQKSHVHAIGLRHTGKEILRDLWLTAAGDAPVYGTVRVGEENRGRHRGR